MKDQLGLFQLDLSFETAPPIPVTHDLPADPVAYYRALIEQHNAAMLRADTDEAKRLRDKAHDLATDMNGGTICGITGPGGPGLMLEAATAAEPGTVPLWGQIGTFEITVDGTRVSIELDGIFGIACGFHYWPGFAARIVDKDKPFPISETGYRSYIGTTHTEIAPNITPEAYAALEIRADLATRKPTRKTRRRGAK